MTESADVPNFDHFMSFIDAVDGDPDPIPNTLPDLMDLSEFEAISEELSRCETDAEKVAALKDLVRWLGRFTF